MSDRDIVLLHSSGRLSVNYDPSESKASPQGQRTRIEATGARGGVVETAGRKRDREEEMTDVADKSWFIRTIYDGFSGSIFVSIDDLLQRATEDEHFERLSRRDLIRDFQRIRDSALDAEGALNV